MTSYLDVCTRIVKTAGQNAKIAFDRHSTSFQFKADGSYVTAVDTNNEAEMIRTILDEYPDHKIIGEETGETGNNTSFSWYLDPLDGTSNFLFGIPIYGCMAALVKDRQVNAAAIAFPQLSLTISASLDHPTQINGHSIARPAASSLKQTTLLMDVGKAKQGKEIASHYLYRHETDFRSIRRYGCVASYSAMLYSGQPFVSMIIEAPAHDLCPLSLILKQSGFETVNRYGQPWTLTDSDLISFPPELTSDVVHTLKTITNAK